MDEVAQYLKYNTLEIRDDVIQMVSGQEIDYDTETIVKILHDIHNSEIPILKYSDENSLSCVLTLGYLSARDTYRIKREEKPGKGYIHREYLIRSVELVYNP